MALRDQVAIITGASSGIGAMIAEYFAKEGANLSLTGRNKENLESVASRCREQSSVDVITTVGDITSDVIRKSLVEKTLDTFHRIDILVNNAGRAIGRPLAEVTPELYDDQMDVNLRSPVLLTSLVASHLMKTKGSVINISSAASTNAPPYAGVYAMSKAALDMYTKVLARELGPQGVRVNSINPGYITTPILYKGEHSKEQADKFLENIRQATPAGRLGTTEEVASFAVFLASNSAPYITGANLTIDGGLTLVAPY